MRKFVVRVLYEVEVEASSEAMAIAAVVDEIEGGEISAASMSIEPAGRIEEIGH